VPKFQITLLAACGGYGQSVRYYSSRVGHVAALLAARAVNHSMKPSVRTRASTSAGNRPAGLSTSPAPVMLPHLYYLGDVQILFNRSPIVGLFTAASVLSAAFPQQEGLHGLSSFRLCLWESTRISGRKGDGGTEKVTLRIASYFELCIWLILLKG
jgi:hypothetical protein